MWMTRCRPSEGCGWVWAPSSTTLGPGIATATEGSSRRQHEDWGRWAYRHHGYWGAAGDGGEAEGGGGASLRPLEAEIVVVAFHAHRDCRCHRRWGWSSLMLGVAVD